MVSYDLPQKAWIFASRRHKGQFYPAAEQLPYTTHLGSVLLEVLPALAERRDLDSETILCCAILHDTIEDTETSIEEIKEEFGERIALAVAALTKNPSLSKSPAVHESLERIKKLPHEAWLVKLADRVANLQSPPPQWTCEKCLSYAAEGQDILAALGAASPHLAKKLAQRIHAWHDYCANAF